MRTRVVVIAAVVGLILLVGAGGVYAYDRARAETIGKAVRVGGVDVSGLSPEEARAKLRRAILDPLSRPVVVRALDKRYRLTPERAKLGVDVDGSVSAAMAHSRAGNVLERTWRGLRGEPIGVDIPLDVTYSKRAVKRLVAKIRAAVDEPAEDASLDLETGNIDPQPSKEGRRVLAGKLKRQIRRQLLGVHAVKRVRAKTAVVEPKVTDEDLADKYPAILVVDRASFRLSLYKHLKLAKSYGIAVGQVGLETPAGLYHIENKAIDPAWHVPNSDWAGDLAGKVIPGGVPENPLKARWMGIYAGAGIHGTDAINSIGTAASHGCIRMRIPEVIELYDQVPVNSPVYIA